MKSRGSATAPALRHASMNSTESGTRIGVMPEAG